MDEKCGCRVIERLAYRPVFYSIEFCPLHAAAPLMLEACKTLVEADNTDVPIITRLEIVLDAIKKAFIAIAAAEKEVE